MDTEQIVITTILAVAGVVVFCSLIYRMADWQQEHLWIEPLILAVIALFIYLVAR